MRNPEKDKAMRGEINDLIADASSMKPEEVFARTRDFEKRYLTDPDFDRSDLDVTQLLYSFYESHGLYGDALRVYRRDRALREMTPFQNHLEFIALLGASGERAVAGDFTLEPGKLRTGRSILIAGAPKSGTTFVESTLMELTGMPFVLFNLDYSLYSGSLVPQLMINQLERDVIAKEHCCDSSAGAAYLDPDGSSVGFRSVALRPGVSAGLPFRVCVSASLARPGHGPL